MFTDFIFPESLANSVGLNEAEARNCKSLVVLAGPNGAGKSRYLKLVPTVVERFLSLPSRLEAQEREHKNFEELLKAGLSDDTRSDYEQKLVKLARAIATLRAIKKTVKWVGQSPSTVKTIPLRYRLAETSFSGGESFMSARPHNPHGVPPESVEKQALAGTEEGFDGAATSVPAYFHEVARAIYDSEHPRQRESTLLAKRLEDAHAFNLLLEKFFGAGVELGLDKSGRPLAYFRGRPFKPQELSEGEQILIIWTILLHRQKERLRGAVVTIDEPENHLHPDACIRALDALRSDDILGPDGQIWLATHSVPLIAYAGLDSVYLVDHGNIEYAGNKIEKVIDRLMGGDGGRTRLRTLLADADDLAFETFAAQCLLPPTVAAPREDDPQQKQMAQAAREIGAGKEDVYILDYAAGRGRLAVSLREEGLKQGRKFTYFAFQDEGYTTADEQRDCLAHIQELGQPQPAESYLVHRLDRLCVPGKPPMDLVVMSNVLHELPVRKWLECFRQIHEVLAADGQLVILEDQLLPVGELPHANGYLVLDDVALMSLFNSDKAIQFQSTARGDRLTAYGIPRSYLLQATTESIVNALKKVRNMAKQQLLLLRKDSPGERSFQSGRRHAHYALLHTNAQLALDEYGAA
ncbi:AAA family ATPase [Pyxidicoccus caerfyrddinensis]|uniref:AAA family ATPase n=1 Tax=Pyxidicoccus caerfyrddinensis TaxID=2709663 RepID=UPI0013DC4F56|nr:AAA family ATPase [Pyxidicoccus caerfyrddinensis]